MEEKATMMESFFEKVEEYSKTNISLFKLKAIDKTADVVSTIVAKIAILIVIMLAVVLLNIALSLWIGESLGKSYYGFIIVAAFYVLIALILHLSGKTILKSPTNNYIILQMTKDKE